jgi:heptosyltransferase-2
MKILLITLSNIGDVILTLPVLDSLKEHFPHADITVMVGPRPKGIFEKNPYIYRLVVYDKHSKVREKIKLFYKLARQNFDLIIDLRNTFFGAFLPAKNRVSPFLSIPENIEHVGSRHLYKIKDLLLKMKAERVFEARETTLFVTEEDKDLIKAVLEENNIKATDRIIAVSAGARSNIKRWSQYRFAELIQQLIKEFDVKVILVGDREDQAVARHIVEHSGCPVVDLTGKTSLTQLAYLLKMARLLITNDSACLHMASYINIPVIAIFGPTNERKYGPWSDNFRIVKKDIYCRPCEKAQCKFQTLECMQLIKTEDVMKQVRDILGPTGFGQQASGAKEDFRRILIVRTDRIGDVLLSTPIIKALRQEYPHTHIAMMVSPYARDIVEGNFDLDEVIIYDKDGLHKSWLASMKFAQKLKKKKFDLALILHPTNRVHLITYFADIRKRVGFNRKLGFLLTDRIKHTKQLGEKHELEYNLDMVRYLGIEPFSKKLFMPIKVESEKWVNEVFRQLGIKETDKLLAIHPGASCPSKIWPNDRFAQVADELAQKFGFKVLIIAGPKDLARAEATAKNMHQPAINLAGKTSVSQLASILKRCQLFISNDSGPVHIASAVGTPVISIFGRAQKGLSPKRWGPLGIKDRFLHKDVGCIECLAHNCVKEMTCIKSITVDDVLKAADSILLS